jgi:hypothetical protein
MGKKRLRMLENRAVRRIFRPGRDEVTEDTDVMRREGENFVICTPQQILRG